jgi:hypothetical protein
MLNAASNSTGAAANPSSPRLVRKDIRLLLALRFYHPAATCDNRYVAERDDEDIEAEHDRLRREVDALRLEHSALERKPVDTAEHRAHRQRLKAQIEKLQAHIERLRAERMHD